MIAGGLTISNFTSCQCYNREDSAIIDDEQMLASPSTAFEALRARLVAVALADCAEEAEQVAQPEPNNCILRTDFDGALMTQEGGPGDCDIARAYQDDTDGNIATGVATDDLPDPSIVIIGLGNNNYEIDADFFQEMIDDPAQLTRDGARIEPRPSPQSYFRFTNVSSGSVAYELGFRSGDTLATINGYYLQDLDEALTAFTAVKDLTSWTVKIKRGPTFIYLNYDLR